MTQQPIESGLLLCSKYISPVDLRDRNSQWFSARGSLEICVVFLIVKNIVEILENGLTVSHKTNSN